MGGGKKVGRKYDGMGKGKWAEKSVWAQAVYEEAARARGDSTAEVLVDLGKAFEQVALNHFWDQGREMGMPLRVLALARKSCAFARRLTYRGGSKRRIKDPFGGAGWKRIRGRPIVCDPC